MAEVMLGGIGLTILKVYEQRPGPDGITAGCAHVHALTEEAYFGLSGEGAIELHDPENGYRRVAIKPGTFVQFKPGTLHRSVSTDGLEVLAVMGNGGLAERGDARIYFGPEVDADPDRFEELKGLAAGGLEGALERRDASAQGYIKLMQLWETDKEAYKAELSRFTALHLESVRQNKAALEAVIRGRVLEPGQAVLDKLSSAGELPPPLASEWRSDDDELVFGMCGILHQVSSIHPLKALLNGFDTPSD